jgi:hypothetical protein
MHKFIHFRLFKFSLFFVYFFGCNLVFARLPDCTPNNSNLCFYAGPVSKNGISTQDRYEGEIKNGKMDGQGEYIFSNGDKYIGQFSEGSFFGRGALLKNDGSSYVGMFQFDQFSGQGTLTFIDGSQYTGIFKEGNYSGQGTYTARDGSKYIGDWKENKRNGFGISYLPNGQIEKQGQWKDDIFTSPLVKTPPPMVNSVNSIKPTINNLISQEQKCLKLGLYPGSEDFKRCIK